jgi:hypothetical protein
VIELFEVMPAVFMWTGGAEHLTIHVQILGLRLEHQVAHAEWRVVDHDLQIVSVMEGAVQRAVLYLGNEFIVLSQLHRHGLATAALLAMSQAFQHAAFGSRCPSQALVLEGTFVSDGERFARALCRGALASKAAPVPIDLARLQAAEQHLSVLAQPQRRPQFGAR